MWPPSSATWLASARLAGAVDAGLRPPPVMSLTVKRVMDLPPGSLVVVRRVDGGQWVLDLRRGYPADFRGEIEQFGEMVSPEDMKQKLQVARAEARRYRERYGTPLELGGAFGEEPQRAVDWDGASLEVPEMGLLHRVGHRMTGKQPRRLAAVAAAVPLGDR